MDVEVNWLAIVLATASCMVVGSIWYSKSTFGNLWMKLARVDEKKMQKVGAVRPILAALAVSFLTAFVLAHVTYLANAYFDQSFLKDALTTGFWLWLGLSAARFVTHDVFEGRPAKLTAINVAYEFVTIMVMALIIGLMQP